MKRSRKITFTSPHGTSGKDDPGLRGNCPDVLILIDYNNISEHIIDNRILQPLTFVHVIFVEAIVEGFSNMRIFSKEMHVVGFIVIFGA